jgi:hypothetical protein
VNIADKIADKLLMTDQDKPGFKHDLALRLSTREQGFRYNRTDQDTHHQTPQIEERVGSVLAGQPFTIQVTGEFQAQ